MTTPSQAQQPQVAPTTTARPVPGAAYGLAECARKLAAALPREQAPSLTTLKRHAGAHRLDAHLAPKQGKRARYYLEGLKAHYESRAVAAAPAQAPAAPTPAGAVSHDELRAVVEQALGPVVAQMADLTKQVSQLNALMAKYDNAALLAQAKIEESQAHVHELRRRVDLDASLSRLTGMVARLTEQLSDRSGRADGPG
jgi:hypothetical protein